jgi:hypothetical protein
VPSPEIRRRGKEETSRQAKVRKNAEKRKETKRLFLKLGTDAKALSLY